MKQITMQPFLKSTAALTLALSLAGFGTISAHAGGKSPPAAYDVSFDNVSADFFALKMTMPKVEVKGSNIAKADIEKMFAKDAPLADRIKALTAFTAGSVDIPAMNLSLEVGPLKVDGIQNGSKLEKIAGGKIGKYSVADATVNIKVLIDEKVDAQLSIKKTETSDLNFVHFIRLWEDKAGPEDKEAQPLYASATVDGFTMNMVDKTGTMKAEYGKMTISAGPKAKPAARPLKVLVDNIVQNVQALSTGEQKPENIEALKTAGLDLIGFAETYQIESYVIDGYTISQAMTFPGTSETISITGKVAKAEASPKLMQASGIEYSFTDKAAVKIGSFALKDFSLAPFFQQARALITGPVTDLNEKAAQRLLASLYANLGTLTLDDLTVDATVPQKAVAPDEDDDEAIDGEAEAPKTDEPAQQAQPAPQFVKVSGSLKNFTLRAEQPVNGLPSSTRISFDNLQMPVSLFGLSGKPSDKQLVEQLTKLGYQKLDMSFAIDTNWNKAANALTINEIRMAEAASGSVTFKGTLGNFTESMFTFDPQVISVAALGLLVKDVSLQIDDKGGLNKALTIAAAEQGMTAEQLKATAPLMLALIPEPFASMSSVTTVKDALLKFWTDPGKLDISIKAKNGSGLGLGDFMAATQDPASIDTKIEVTATATK